MVVDLVIEDERWEAFGLEALAERAVSATLADRAVEGEVALLACDDTRIADLNSEFRQKGQPTNVLSWPSEERGAVAPGGAPYPPTDEELGDIAIAYDTCEREASEQGKSMEHHVTHLLVHGTLHLLGYDHIDDKDADLMENLEVEILGKLGIADPYGEAES
ncbi:rRNA maturation RNase YbeY [uncultured Maritimibacter sp.]|jgi:probable rRNA maturation factor|uniref:rRNA maturation RNase YbeY n=1 Tax=uncultured Maritimibacter sp. TaxID=991866 RepID=UPI000B1195B0|nr:rRNA maturation RNase YbeY [uncultured Maritimibacter sp.]